MILLLGFLFTVALVIAGIAVMVRSLKVHLDQPLCPGCGYDLRANRDPVKRCPECGYVWAPARDTRAYVERRWMYLLIGMALVALASASVWVVILLAARVAR